MLHPNWFSIWYCQGRLAAFRVHHPKQSVCIISSTANAPNVVLRQNPKSACTAGAHTDVFHAVVNKRLKGNVRMVIEETVVLRWEGAAESHNIQNVRMASIEKLDASCVAENMCALSLDATL